MKLVLASASPRRVELLGRLGVPFIVEPAHAEEWAIHPDGPAALVSHNAAMKAAAISGQFPDSWVLGSDTTVALGEKIYGKPTDLEDASRMLMKLAGKTHSVYTAVCLMHADSNQSETFYDTAEVTFKPLSQREIHDYIQRVNPLDKAGAYGIQAHRERIIAAVDGAVDTVMGLPLQALAERLRKIGWRVQDL
jgi:septum formation protein